MSSSSALQQERENFLKRQAEAFASRPSNEKRVKTEKSAQPKANRPKQSITRAKTSSDLGSDYPMTISGKPRLQILKIIVDKLKERFLERNFEPLTIEEIASETNLTLDPSDRHWLVSGPLLSNFVFDVKNIDDVNKFVYKPPYKIKLPRRQGLLNLLKSRHEECVGSVYADDIRDSLPRNPSIKSDEPRKDEDKAITELIKSGEILKVTASNKKEVFFYTDQAYNLRVHSEFIKAWKSISVEGKTQEEIMEELKNEGHRSLVSNRPRAAPSKPTKPTKRAGRRPDTLKFNQHVADQLEDYSTITVKK